MSRFSQWIGRSGFQLGMIRLGRFKILIYAITGFKYGRLAGKLYEYRRFKPFYLAWGLTQEKECLLRRYNTGHFRLEIVPIRIDLYITPKDVWAHWMELRRSANEVSAAKPQQENLENPAGAPPQEEGT